MPIYQHLIKFLTANGVDGNTAQKVASRIQRKAQQNANVLQQEWSIVYETIQRIPFSSFDRMMLQRLLEKSPQSTEEGASRLGMKVGRVGMKVKGMGDKVYKIGYPPPPQALKWKLERAYIKPWSTSGDADATPLSPAMIRQLAYRIVSY